MEKYLYGAAVQGIQSFIFSVNELKCIIGASSLVEDICTTMFGEFAVRGETIVAAAGNVKYIFDNEEDCRNAVMNFPKKVMNAAEGITISQAVVVYNEEKDDFGRKIDELESKLRVQRNKPVRPLNIGFVGFKRSPQTGFPVETNGRDRGVNQKMEYATPANERLATKFFGEGNIKNDLTYNISDMTGQNDWMAIIHADGNGLGMVVQKIGYDKVLFQKFSHELDEATKAAARRAFEDLTELQKHSKYGYLTARPIVIGGDDLTVVCRADIALPFTEKFLRYFEEETEQRMSGEILEKLSFKKLTACAGIAFIKSSYPFYYGYQLAESLCDRAKRDAKKSDHLVDTLAPSCLMFHKVQDSFVEDYSSIVLRELTPSENCSFEYGPYYKDQLKKDDRWTISELIYNVSVLGKQDKDANAVKSHLRQWMSLMHEDKGSADQKIKRVLDMLGATNKLSLTVENLTKGDARDSKTCYPVYDILSIVSIENQRTDENN